MTWTIPEHKLDKALAAYRKQEHTFKQRIKKAAIYLSPRDAEVIILLATHNIVQLELVIPPIQIREKTLLFMIWNILQLIFCIILFVLPLALYKSHRSFYGKSMML